MTYDFTPLFRSAIGFDRFARAAGTVANAQAVPSYPPYNIEKTADTDYVLTMALAGFGPEDISVVQESSTLVVRGRLPEGGRAREWLHRGIATRAFERRFVLADHMEVERAELLNGLLSIYARQVVPEAARPRHIPVRPQADAPATVSGAGAGATAEDPAQDHLAQDRLAPEHLVANPGDSAVAA